jgi:hypothetical protein
LEISLKLGLQIIPTMKGIYVNYPSKEAKTGVAVGGYSAKLKNGKNSLPRIPSFTLRNLEVYGHGSDLGG